MEERQRSNLKGGLIVAVQIVSWAHTQHLTVPLVEPDPTLDPRIRAAPAFKSPVYYVGDHTKPGSPPGLRVSTRWGPCSDNHIMRRWLVSLCPHPKPYGCSERHNSVSSH